MHADQKYFIKQNNKQRQQMYSNWPSTALPDWNLATLVLQAFHQMMMCSLMSIQFFTPLACLYTLLYSFIHHSLVYLIWWNFRLFCAVVVSRDFLLADEGLSLQHFTFYVMFCIADIYFVFSYHFKENKCYDAIYSPYYSMPVDHKHWI